jgi:hypothetical protein
LKSYFKPVLQPFETPPFSLLSPKVSAKKKEANQKKKGEEKKRSLSSPSNLSLAHPSSCRYRPCTAAYPALHVAMAAMGRLKACIPKL